MPVNPSSMFSTRIAFDIETQPNPAAVASMPEPEVKCGNLKDPVKIAEKIREAKEEQASRAALDPHFGRVVCISIAHQTDKEFVQTLIRQDVAHEGVDAAEHTLLKWFWDYIRAISDHVQIITFNGASFDVPFLTRRSRLLGIRPVHINCHPYQVVDPTCDHFDVYRYLDETGTGNPCNVKKNLRFYCREFLGRDIGYAELDKSTIGEMFDRGEHGKIEEICKNDVLATLELAERLLSVGV